MRFHQLLEAFEEEHGFRLPTQWEVCGQCHGKGTSSAYLGAYTQDEMAEAGEEFREDYMSGFYDRTCDECDGRTTVLAVDEQSLPPEHLKLWHDLLREEYEYRREVEMERRMGA